MGFDLLWFNWAYSFFVAIEQRRIGLRKTGLNSFIVILQEQELNELLFSL